MNLVIAAREGLGEFFETGGMVLVVIFICTLAMWTLIAERFVYRWFFFPREAARAVADWNQRPDRSSWYAVQIRREILSVLEQKLSRSLPLLKTLVALCPLLGLLGTVVGMIQVFDVMAIVGNSNPRAMAAGISQATVTTMAGLVASLSGLYFSVQLARTPERERRKYQELMLGD